jgi:membrane protein DedA with SNARE-associated domain
MRVFVVGTAAAGAIWATLYFWMGFLLAGSYGRLTEAHLGAWPLFAALVAVGLGTLAWRRIARRRELNGTTR